MTDTAATEGQTPTTQQSTEGGQTPPSASGSTPGQQTNGTNDEGQTSRPFDPAYVHSLREEAKQHRLRADALQAEKEERDQANMSELQKTQSKLTSEKQRADAAELALARFQVAIEKEIPDWADLLQGSTREELESNADALKQRLGGAVQTAPGAPDFGAGARPNGGTVGDDFNAMLRRSAGRA